MTCKAFICFYFPLSTFFYIKFDLEFEYFIKGISLKSLHQMYIYDCVFFSLFILSLKSCKKFHDKIFRIQFQLKIKIEKKIYLCNVRLFWYVSSIELFKYDIIVFYCNRRGDSIEKKLNLCTRNYKSMWSYVPFNSWKILLSIN